MRGLPIAQLLGRVLESTTPQGSLGGLSAGSSDATGYQPTSVARASSPSRIGSLSRPPGSAPSGAAAGPNLSPSGSTANGAAPAHGNSVSFEAYNPYSYTYDNPVNYVDPNGYNPVLIGIGIAIGLGTTLASDDAAKQREAHPAAAANPVLGLLYNLGVLAPAGVGRIFSSSGAPVAATGAQVAVGQSTASTVESVVNASGGSLHRAVVEINKAGLNQSQAVEAIVQVTRASGRDVGDVVELAGGARAIPGVTQGVGQPIVHISASGTATFTEATVQVGLDASGKVVTTITDVGLK
jgi:hypothetical protein